MSCRALISLPDFAVGAQGLRLLEQFLNLAVGRGRVLAVDQVGL
jgi:hypothetical protein